MQKLFAKARLRWRDAEAQRQCSLDKSVPHRTMVPVITSLLERLPQKPPMAGCIRKPRKTAPKSGGWGGERGENGWFGASMLSALLVAMVTASFLLQCPAKDPYSLPSRRKLDRVRHDLNSGGGLSISFFTGVDVCYVRA